MCEEGTGDAEKEENREILIEAAKKARSKKGGASIVIECIDRIEDDKVVDDVLDGLTRNDLTKKEVCDLGKKGS